MSRMFCGVMLLSSTGCSAGNISKREAEQTFDAVTTVASVVIQQTRQGVEDGSGGLSIDTNGANFEIEGELDNEGGFAGTVGISGTANQQGNDFTYDIVVTLEDAQDDAGTVVNGDLTLSFFAEDVGDIDLDLAVGSSLDGTLEVSGAAEGTATIEYDLEFRIQGLDVSLTAEGDINGHDVSGWDDLTITL